MDVVRRLVESRPDMWALETASPKGPRKINDFIYCSPGVSNAYMLLADGGRIVINTGMGFEAPAHIANFAQVCPGPTPYIILTQGHVDHVGGVSQFREPGTQVIAQRANPDCQADDARIATIRSQQSSVWFPRPTGMLTGKVSLPAGVVQDRPTPDILFDDRFDLEFGGLRLELLSVPGGETVDSLAVHLPDHGIVFTGNMFGPLFPHFPNLYTIRGDRYRYAEPYMASLARVRALEPEMLVTGHFEPIVGRDLIRTCLDRLEAAVDHVHRSTLAGLNADKDIWTLMREIQLPDELYVGQAYGKVSWGVRSTWEAYLGWFKGAHTSDLYATPPHRIFPELVRLAGLDAIIARGRELAAAGDLDAAVLMAEAALESEPAGADARRFARDVHAQMLDRSGGRNFWEVGWLKHKIAALEAPAAE
jgi:glyoxylase-like metal-dependent hydrolase (beta-lactamase superfamily II)